MLVSIWEQKILDYLSFSISITIISWMVGMISGALLIAVIKNRSSYVVLSNLNFVRDERLNTIIGLRYFKWIVVNTFFKYLNPNIKLTHKSKMPQLIDLRKEMTLAEIFHLIGFLFVVVFVLVKIFNGDYLFGMIMMAVNILMNLYPCLLQQQNKRRLDQLIGTMTARCSAS